MNALVRSIFLSMYLYQLFGTLSQLWELLFWVFALWWHHFLSPSHGDRTHVVKPVKNTHYFRHKQLKINWYTSLVPATHNNRGSESKICVES